MFPSYPRRPALPAGERDGTFAPFRYPVFAMIWSASFVANVGTVVQTMAAAWVMTHLASSSAMVALVQTATSLPTTLLALFTGVTADRFGRRRQMLGAQGLAFLAGCALTCAAVVGSLTPWTLLFYSFLLGIAQAIYLPAWQSSIGEQVPRSLVPAAIAWNAVGLNTARCVGPMIGGIALALLGPAFAFGFNTIGFLCVIAALTAWQVSPAESNTGASSLWASLCEGLEFAASRPSLRATYLRCALFAAVAACPYAFLPLIARNLMGGRIEDYTLVQSLFGVGAVVAGVALGHLRRSRPLHALLVTSSVMIGIAMAVVGAAVSQYLTAAALVVIGAAWVIGFSGFNIATQAHSPSPLIGRLLSMYQMTISLGLAAGSAFWGAVSRTLGIGSTLELAGVIMLLMQVIMGRNLKIVEA